MRARLILTLISALLVTLVGIDKAISASLASFQSHDLRVAIDLPSQQATISDNGAVGVASGWNFFYLNGDSKIVTLTIGGNQIDYHVVSLADTAQLPADIKGEMPKIEADGNPLLVFFESKETVSVVFDISYTAKFDDAVENVQFSRESVGNEVRGTILEQGAYLSPASYYYPMGAESLVKFRVTTDLPEGWLSVSDGDPVVSMSRDGRRVETFENPYANDGLTVMAAPYVARIETHGGVEVAAYFFEADTALAGGYVVAAAKYLKMYSELIGPYPFKRFTIAENFFPTGYGFPAWTLLGQQVLRLPFIKATSLGHEVLHNWWGNSVYVDYERGNWCEGLTVYGADYRYKLMESEAAARDYRKDILKEYVSYVNQGNDFPLREFKSRTSAETRSIGYNKAMMVFHMIQQQIGEQAFFNAWKLVYSQYKAAQVSWEDWVAAYEQTSGQDLSWVIPEWIDRAGAPVLELPTAEKSMDQGLSSVRFELRQDPERVFNLRIPFRFVGTSAAIDTFVVFDGAAESYSFNLNADVKGVEIDPDYHLFRKLYSEEIEPILSGVLGASRKRFVADAINDSARSFFESFAASLSESDAAVESSRILGEGLKDYAPVMLNPTELPDVIAGSLISTDSTLIINGTEYARKGYTFLLAGRDWNGFGTYLVIISDDLQSLPRIGQLAPHYGKYSYLVFEGAKNVGKGQWPTSSSPLKKEF